MKVEIKKTKESEQAYRIAQQLSKFFNSEGLQKIEKETKEHILFGAYIDVGMVGFVIYNLINEDVVELSWLGVLPDMQDKGIGTKLVTESLRQMGKVYKICKVRTLADVDDYEPFKKTREFYKNLGFIPIETIFPYPGWGDNPCELFVKNLL